MRNSFENIFKFLRDLERPECICIYQNLNEVLFALNRVDRFAEEEPHALLSLSLSANFPYKSDYLSFIFSTHTLSWRWPWSNQQPFDYKATTVIF